MKKSCPEFLNSNVAGEVLERIVSCESNSSPPDLSDSLNQRYSL